MKWLRTGPLAMSVEAAIPDKFWPAVHWACTYVFSWVLPLVALERLLDGHLWIGGAVSFSTLVDWFVAAKWESIARFVNRWRRPMAFVFISTGAVCLAVGILLLWSVQPQPATLTVAPNAFVKTSLVLQFYGDHRIPVQVGESENIYYWYAQFSPSLGMTFHDKDGNEIVPPGSAPRFGPMWNVFVVLKQPTVRRQIVTTFTNPEKMGPSEIIGETDRSFIFHSFKEMPAGVLEIRTEQ